MLAITSMRINDELPNDKIITLSIPKLMKIPKKRIKALKRELLANKKGLCKDINNLLPNYNQIFIKLMNITSSLVKIQLPHPELDPRLKYNSVYFQPAHPFYSKSVLQMLSYALSSSLNNYYSLLKEQRIVVANLHESTQQKKEGIAIQKKLLQYKAITFIKQNTVQTVLTKNKNRGQGQERVQNIQKCILNHSTIIQNSSSEIKAIIAKKESQIFPNQGKQSLKFYKKEYFLLISDQKLISQAKLPKWGLRKQEKQLLRQNLLMRQVLSFPIKQRPKETSREIRSLHK